MLDVEPFVERLMMTAHENNLYGLMDGDIPYEKLSERTKMQLRVMVQAILLEIKNSGLIVDESKK